MSHWYAVCSREYSYIEPVTDWGDGPRYDARLFVWVRARTARRAKVLAVRWFRKYDPEWHRYLDDYDVCPFTGMTTEKMTPEDIEEMRELS